MNNKQTPPQFTLVSTVYNEIQRLADSIADIEAQTLKPTEIIIVDAGSSDGTLEALQNWANNSTIAIKIIQEKGCTIARGRNLAISKASHGIIVSTDFGCRFAPQWLESLIQAFNEKTDVVAGAFSIKEEEVNTLAAKADFILQAGYPVVMDACFSASSRSVAYRKKVWETLGGYEEWLTLAADDTIFWRLIKKQGFIYKFVEKPYVYWQRHKTFRAFAKETYRYGLGDGESGINFKNYLSHLIETGLRYSLFINIILLLIFPLSLYVQAFVAIVQLFGLRSYKNAWKNWKALKSRDYNLNVFAASLYMVELSRLYYLKAYTLGYFFSSPKVKSARKVLQKRLEKAS